MPSRTAYQRSVPPTVPTLRRLEHIPRPFGHHFTAILLLCIAHAATSALALCRWYVKSTTTDQRHKAGDCAELPPPTERTPCRMCYTPGIGSCS